MYFNRIRATDLNLFILFQALMDERNISRAAEKMNLTQPAMSRALQRLQHVFKDDLLLRTANGYEPTSRAIQIQKELNLLLPKIENLLESEKFRPELQTGNLKIAATDFGSFVILPPFLKLLSQQAPQLELTIKHWHANTFSRLEAGALDLALWTHKCPPNLNSELLFRDELVCVVSREHPLTKGPMSLKKYLSFPHVGISLRNGKQEPIDQWLEDQGLSRKILVRTPYSTAAAFLAEEGEAILTLPSRIIKKVAPLTKITTVAAPKDFPMLEYIQIWHPRADQNPYSQWIRSLVKKACT